MNDLDLNFAIEHRTVTFATTVSNLGDPFSVENFFNLNGNVRFLQQKFPDCNLHLFGSGIFSSIGYQTSFKPDKFRTMEVVAVKHPH